MSNRLYVGNLPYSMVEDQLVDHFAQAGVVIEASIVNDRETGRSRGFGFVEMGSSEDAQKAIEMFNGQDMAGRNLVVNEARPREERGGGGGGGGRRGGGGGGYGGGGGGRDRGGRGGGSGWDR
jgi:RNA recognition motif-containing protein